MITNENIRQKTEAKKASASGMLKRRISGRIAALALAAFIPFGLAGCEEPSEAFEQAGRDLEQGSYEYTLQGYEACYNGGVLPVRSARGAGIACLRMGNYADAAAWFTEALGNEKIDKAARKDILYYRATANMKSDQYESAMSDCQILLSDFGEDAETCFLTGAVALAMDSYEEASDNFDKAYSQAKGYDMAIQIYQQYIDRGMEADGTRFLEASLDNTPDSADDYCDRGRIYYYMDDYASAVTELTQAVNKGSTDALLLLGMVYNAQKQSSKARAMYQQYLEAGGSAAKAYDGMALCDMEESKFDSALDNIQKGKPSATTEELQSLLFNEIVVYEKKLDFDTALSLAEDYAEMFPEDSEAARELDFLRSRRKAAGTEEASAETTEGNPGSTGGDAGSSDGSSSGGSNSDGSNSDGSGSDGSYSDGSYDDGSYDDSYYDESYYDESYYDENYYDESYYDDSYY